VIEWVVAPLAVVLAFWLPGVAVLRLAGARLHVIELTAAAPAVTIGVCAIAAETARAAGLQWGLSTAVAATALAVAIVVGLRVRAARTRPAAPAPRRDRTVLLGAVGAAIAVQLGVVVGVMGDPRILLAANDAGAHMTMLRGVVATGQASALTLSGAHELDGIARSVYPAGWHAVAALAVPAGGVAATFTWAWLLPAVAAWTCGIVALTRAAFPRRPAILPWVALVTGPGVALPLTLTLSPEGMVPNTVGAALVPGVLALLVGDRRAWPAPVPRVVVGVLGLVGLAAVHPNTFLSLALLGAGWWCPSLARHVRRWWSSGGQRRRAVLAAAVLLPVLAAGAGIAAARNAEIRYMLTTHDEGALPPATAAWALVTADATLMTVGCGFVLVVAAVVGAVLVRRRRGRPMAVGALVMAVFFLAASSRLPVLSFLDAPWYDESRRYAPIVTAGVLPLAAYGGHAAVRWLAARTRHPVRGLIRVAVPILAFLGVVVPGSLSLSGVVAQSAHGTADTPPIADEPEMALLARLPGELSGGAVLSGPFSGGSSLYAVSGYPTVPRDATTAPPPALRDLVPRLGSLGTDPRACADLAALGVRYLYVDPQPWQGWKVLPLDRALAKPPVSGVRLIDTGGRARLYEITACP
jgi:hypothetical protein